MIRRSLLIGAAALALATPGLANTAAANDLLTPALLRQIQTRPGQGQAPAPTQGGFFDNLTLGQMIGTMSGAVVGKVVLESALDLPQGVGVVAGAVVGYYVWKNYVSTMEGPSAAPRKASGNGSEARAYLIGDAMMDTMFWAPRPAFLQR